MPRKPLPDHLKKSKRMEVSARPADVDLVYEAIHANLEAGIAVPASFAAYILRAGVQQAKQDLQELKEAQAAATG